MMIRPVLVAAATLLIALPARAAQEHSAVTLTYLPSRAVVAVCPEADYLQNEVFVRLGYELFQPSAPKHLTVKLDRTSGGFRAVGEMVDDDGKVVFARTYPAMDCTFAVFSVAVGISIHFMQPPEPSAPPPPPPPPPEPPSPAETLPSSPPELEPAELPPVPVAPPPLPPGRRFQAGFASVFSIGTAPTVVGGVGGFLGVRCPTVSLALEGRALFAPSATIEQVKTRDGYHFTYTALSGSVCHQPGWFFACARVEAGNLSFGNAQVRLNPSQMIILGLGARFGGDIRLTSSLALRAYIELLGQPLPGRFGKMPGSSILWIQTGVSGSIGLGPVFTFSGI
ncbi:MAG: hypothetical protein ABJE95_19960 [Byssovorax sp.]